MSHAKYAKDFGFLVENASREARVMAWRRSAEGGTGAQAEGQAPEIPRDRRTLLRITDLLLHLRLDQRLLRLSALRTAPKPLGRKTTADHLPKHAQHAASVRNAHQITGLLLCLTSVSMLATPLCP